MSVTSSKSRLWKSFVAASRSRTTKVKQGPASAGAIPREWPANPDAYELLGQIGKGAAAVVYRANCKAFNTEVAVRKLDLDASGHTDLASLVKEATLMRRFDHPGVLPLHAAFVAGRELWMVTPYMGQGSVRGIMLRQFPEGLDEVVIASIMKYVLMGLQYVHKNGGIHRDIKADNILISESGHVCLGDFGVASAHHRLIIPSEANLAELRAKTFVGTPCWMAPEVMEQLDGGYDTAADIWSFGITLMELALGKPPMAKLHPMRVVMATINNPPPSLEDHPSGKKFSKAFRAVVDACLHKDPVERPTAEELLQTRFFKQAKGSDFLSKHFLSAVPLPEATKGRLRRGASNRLKELMAPIGSGRLVSAWFFPPLEQNPAGQLAEGDEQDQEGVSRTQKLQQPQQQSQQQQSQQQQSQQQQSQQQQSQQQQSQQQQQQQQSQQQQQQQQQSQQQQSQQQQQQSQQQQSQQQQSQQQQSQQQQQDLQVNKRDQEGAAILGDVTAAAAATKPRSHCSSRNEAVVELSQQQEEDVLLAAAGAEEEPLQRCELTRRQVLPPPQQQQDVYQVKHPPALQLQSPFQAAATHQWDKQKEQQQQEQGQQQQQQQQEEGQKVVNLLQAVSPILPVPSSSQHSRGLSNWFQRRSLLFGNPGPADTRSSSGGGCSSSVIPEATDNNAGSSKSISCGWTSPVAAVHAMLKARRAKQAAAQADIEVFASKPRIAAARAS